MALGHEHHEEAHHAHHGPRTLPSTLAAPTEALSAWRMRALVVAGVAVLLSIPFVLSDEGRNHLMRAYLMGIMTVFNFLGGALFLLMIQYVTGGKWGMILRRPLEAMTRTIPLVAGLFLVSILFWKRLYLWALYPNDAAAMDAQKNGLINLEERLVLHAKHAMLNPTSVIIQMVFVFAVLGLVIKLLNNWSLQRDADPEAGTQASYDRWRVKFENLSGPMIFFYVVMLTAVTIDLVKSLDITWYSTIYGLQFLVAQGYAVLALGILTLVLLSRLEPIKSLLRQTEMHDLGKFLFAFVMLNMYLTFAEFLIIWSGNLPDEIPWYLNRIHGGWWVICSMDFVCHWVIPFCMLLSRTLKRSKQRMIILTCFMIFARLVDMFWLIEPNFPDARGNLHLSGNLGILAYITVPVAVIAIWAWYYITQLMSRPLVSTNDPHLEELLEPEHAH